MNAFISRIVFLLFLALTITNTSAAFTLMPGDVVRVPFDQVPYIETVTAPGHGSTTSLFIDLNPATFQPGDSVQVQLWSSADAFTPFLAAEANVNQIHQPHGESWRFGQTIFAEPYRSGIFEIRMLSGSVEIDAVTFEHFLSDFDYPRGANPGAPDDYNIYRVSVTQIPEPPPSVLALAILAVLASARAFRKSAVMNPPRKIAPFRSAPRASAEASADSCPSANPSKCTACQKRLSTVSYPG